MSLIVYTILIIEDDRTVRQELKVLLERYKYRVIVTEDFENVVDFTISTNPHLVLLDLNLPIYDGFQVCRELRRHSQLPIVVVTCRSGEADQLMCLNLGADYYVTKPFNTGILLAQIATLLSRTYESATPALVRCGELVVDVGQSQVRLGQRSADLTKNELRILRLLAEREGAIVSRGEIMETLWQTEAYVDDNTLTVNINRLRKKLGQIGAAEVLRTKRGQGYSL
ncbi:MAG: response regulator transcription factor [Propionibacteriaceae bacterium]|nr:response regulator transcription factor [Propionibacteriaceae bacterium]